MQLDLGSVRIAPHADCFLFLLGQSREPWRVLADIMQMQVRMANCWNDSDLRLLGTWERFGLGRGMLEDSLRRGWS
jgi:hypothetical protein